MWERIKAFFSGVGEFLTKFARTMTGQLVENIGPIAYKVVKGVEQAAANSPEDINKFDVAKKQLIRELERRSFTWTIKAIHAAIETAVGLLEANGEEIKSEKN